MAEIFLAHVKGVEGFSKTIVLKRILPHLAEQKEFVSMFIDEAKLAATLTHPNIVQVYELGSIENRYFIAMEYVPGIDLSTLTKRIWHEGQSVPPGAVLTIVIDALRGLHYAHEKKDLDGRPLGLVHRDVSPQNILISVEGMTKITDFGIAKAESNSTKTRSGVLKGKFAYMAPEQALGRTIDRRADLFAMGIVAYELFTSARAYKSDNDLEMLDMARQAKLPPLTEVVPGFPESLSQLIHKALAPACDDRFATCAEFANALAREGHALTEPYDTEKLSELVVKHAHSEAACEPIELTDSAVVGTSAVDPSLTSISDVHEGGLKRGSGTQPTGTNTKPLQPKRWPVYVGTGALVLATIVVTIQLIRPLSEPTPTTARPLEAATKPPEAVTPTSEPASQPATTPIKPAPPEQPKQAAAGFLTLNSRPWAYVYIDGKKLSNTTPLQKYRLSAGAHRVRLDSPGAGRDEEFTVTIRAGQVEKKIIDFERK